MAERGKFHLPEEVRAVVDSARQRVQKGMTLGRAGTTTALASVPLGIIDVRLAVAGTILGTGIGLVGAAEADLPYLDQIKFGDSTAQEPAQLPAGFHEAETTIMSVEEIASAMAARAKETPPRS